MQEPGAMASAASLASAGDASSVEASVPASASAPTVIGIFTALKPPPGAGLNTSIFSVPADARYDAGIVAVSCVAETNSVGIPCASIAAEDDARKLDPV